jgi:hypothetical protein
MHKVFQYLLIKKKSLSIFSFHVVSPCYNDSVTIGSPVLLPQALAISPLWWISLVRVLWP